MTSAETVERPPRRRDARRNRALIVEAAREVFAAAGFDAPLDAVARRAGVGRGTLYRHFPDRYALAVAIFEVEVRDIERLAETYDGRADAFDALLQSVVERQVRSHGLVAALLKGAEAPDLQALGRRVVRLFARPMVRAQEDGAVRADLGADDVLGVMRMIASVAEGEEDPVQRRAAAGRALDLLRNGLRG